MNEKNSLFKNKNTFFGGKLFRSILLISLILAFTLSVSSSILSANIWTTDSGGIIKTDFQPEEIVYISGNGFTGTQITQIDVTRPTGVIDVCGIGGNDNGRCPAALPTLTAGAFSSYPYTLDGDEGLYTIDVSDNAGISAQTNFTDSRTILWVTLDGGTQWTNGTNGGPVTVAPSAIITVQMRVSVTSSSDWKATGWDVIGGSSSGCDDFEPNHTSSGSPHTETFTINAPSTPGTYDLLLQTRRYDDCSSGSGEITLIDAITVSSPAVSMTVHLDKIVCNSEDDLPNWGGGAADITANTASNYVNTHSSDCYLANDWYFQWARSTDLGFTGNPGDNLLTPAPAPWHESGQTVDGRATVTINDALNGTIWFREELQTGYLGFSGDNTTQDVSAEFYCDGDVLNYDNYDNVNRDLITNGSTFYCVAFNVLKCETDSDCVHLDNPPCYFGQCNTKTHTCEQVFVDTTGPTTSNLVATKHSGLCQVKIEATETDVCSNIAAAEYFLAGATCGAAGTGTAMDAKDGSFDSLIEDVIKNNVAVGDGHLNIHVRGKDAQGNWGACKTIGLNIDCIPPDYPTNVALDGNVNANELLVCDNDPLLTAHICDSESRIQLAEYFIDEDSPLDWWGIPMTASDGLFDEQCEDVEGQIDLDPLSEGTHYVQLHGKDGQENWGKFDFSPIVSLIKDTIKPKTEKVVHPADGKSVDCGITNIGAFTIDSGCKYVKTGTTIDLTAYDFNPDDSTNDGYNNLPGEYSDQVVIHYKIWWSEDGIVWNIPTEQTGNPNEPVTITLADDSYHVIEYWATDGCGWPEDHHFELDIVDTQAPITTKQIIGTQIQGDGFTWITNETTIVLDCVDQQPHPVDSVTLYWRWNVDGGEWNGWFSNSCTGHEEINFAEDSVHTLEWYCEDALGNTELTQTETDKVDSTSPTTKKEYGTPFYTNGTSDWITSQTLITLTATDGGDICHIDGVTTYYRYARVDDSMCYGACQPIQWEEPVPAWETYSSAFTIPDESCHYIEFYSEDALGNIEGLQYQCTFVDNTAPETQKYIKYPKYPGIDESNWWVSQDTWIKFNCDDAMPHPVGKEKFCYKISYDGEPNWLTKKYCDAFEGTMTGETLDAWCCKDISEPIGFELCEPGDELCRSDYKLHFLEDSQHDIEYYCSDKLGNTETAKIEWDNVDTAPPEIIKSVSDDTVQPEDTVQICANVVDKKLLTDDPGVGVKSVWAKLTLGDDPIWIELLKQEGDNYCADWIAPQINSYCHQYRCVWELDVKAKDYLDNYQWEDGIEIIVDQAKPQILSVLKPHAGEYYRDGKPFSVYAPAIDFGGNPNIYDRDNCKASGVYECRFYALDYPYEWVDQSEVKDYWDYVYQLRNIEDHPEVVFLGSTPYDTEAMACKGTVRIPEESGLTDVVFLAYEIEDNAGNIGDGLAEDASGDFITMQIDNEGPGVIITDLGNLPGPLTSGDNVRVQAEIQEYESGFDDCWADIYKCNGEICTEDTGIKLDGQALDFDLCEINGILPDGLESGYYQLKVNARDEQFNIGSDWADLTVDNTRPTMGVVSPLKGNVYSGIAFPVSLHLEDDFAGIASETVMFKIKEIGLTGGTCLGVCEDTGWIPLPNTTDSFYATTVDLTEYGITGNARYVFDAIACDTLYWPDPDPDNPLGIDMSEDRNTRHCKMISKHGAVEEPMPQCNDGLDNDFDGYIDYSADVGCDSLEDNDEDAPVCGNGILEGSEECDWDGDNGILCIPGYDDSCDYCSSECVLETVEGGYCGDEIVNGEEQCEFNSDCSEGYYCDGCSCYQETPSTETICNDELDNDFDGYTDCYDSDCFEDSYCQPQ